MMRAVDHLDTVYGILTDQRSPCATDGNFREMYNAMGVSKPHALSWTFTSGENHQVETIFRLCQLVVSSSNARDCLIDAYLSPALP